MNVLDVGFGVRPIPGPGAGPVGRGPMMPGGTVGLFVSAWLCRRLPKLPPLDDAAGRFGKLGDDAVLIAEYALADVKPRLKGERVVETLPERF